ncbi:di-heme oxidoredictase family protein [Chitinimonas taiwanensis]|uniref:di-heme oxidoredictase family protein n=1 Tax=Chitinimonas taiwanensis TaxID=240412 RepID=UPI0035AE2D98
MDRQTSPAAWPLGGRLLVGLLIGLLGLSACGGGGDDTGSNAPPSGTPPVSNPPSSGDSYVPLSWNDAEPNSQYTLADGTLVSRLGGRVRDRHAREQSEAASNLGQDLYQVFAPHYFERRTHDITLYDQAVPGKPDNRMLTVVVRPQWWWYGTNFRHGFIGRRDGDPQGPAAVALYGDNGGMKLLPAFSLKSGQELKTPLANYDSLPGDPNSNYDTDLAVPPKDGEFVLVKEIRYSPGLRRELRAGDLVEFELGIFLAGKQGDALGRFNYYADAIVYQMGSPGARAWQRGPCCNAGQIPWDSKLMPESALAGGRNMTLHEDASYEPEMNLMQAGTNIAGRNIQRFAEGRRLFHSSFLNGAHMEAGNPTLLSQVANKAGPNFQQATCIQCHFNNGKSSPGLGVALSNMVVLTGENDAAGQLRIDGRFGGRIAMGLVQDGNKTHDGRQAVLKIASYSSVDGQYADGTRYSLQKPNYTLSDLDGKPLALPARLSVRATPHLAGMGLLEAVPEADIAALAKASERDPDGAVGRLQLVPDLANPAIQRLGRFGWRATSASVLDQAAEALNGDMGVTSRLKPKHLCGLADGASACRAADAAGPEISDAEIDLLTRYVSLLGVPPQRRFAGQQPQGIVATKILSQDAAATAAQEAAELAKQQDVARGGQLFATARCTACHVASLSTGSQHRFAELRQQTIRPYTDLLLHDMGPELSDNYPQGRASGQEWRTAPLWGLGLLASINPNTRYLHDGRARNLEEAVLWHGGQASKSRERFKALSAKERQQLLDFVSSL